MTRCNFCPTEQSINCQTETEAQNCNWRKMIERESSRKSGRTMEMVKQLPETGSVVIVHSEALRAYVRKMIADIRGREVATRTVVAICCTIDLARTQLTGRRMLVFIDHAFFDNVPIDVMELTMSLASACNGVDWNKAHG